MYAMLAKYYSKKINYCYLSYFYIFHPDLILRFAIKLFK